MKDNSRKLNIFFWIGALLVLTGVVVNIWTVSLFFSFGGSISVFDKTVVSVFDIVMISAGVLIIHYRDRIHIQLDKKNAALLLGTLVLLFVFAEISARVVDYMHGGDFSYNKEREERPLIPFRMFGPSFYTKQNEETYISSRHGELYPLQKGDNTFRVVAFGGSTTQDFVGGVHYPLVLQQLLQDQFPKKNIEVINVGNSGYATPHFIILLSLDVLSWNPDLIILSENVNDLLAAYFPDFQYDYANKYANPAFLPSQSIPRKMFGWSRFYWVVKSRVAALSYRFAALKGDAFTRSSYSNELPQEAQDIFRRNLTTFIQIAQARHIPVILGTQPLEPSEEYWNRHMQYKTYNDIAVYPLHEEFVAHHKLYNNIIKEIAQSNDVYLADNDTLFNGQSDLFVDFVHYTKQGIERLAGNYYNVIITNHIIR